MASLRTQVAVIGAGPAGLTLANRLRQEGISCVVLEREAEEVVRSTPRAGFLEEWAVHALARHGLASKALQVEVPRHSSVEFRFDRERHVVDYGTLTGHHHYVYPQQRLVGDLLDRFTESGGDIRFDVQDLRLHDAAGERERVHPSVTWTDPVTGSRRLLECEYIAGCDGARGVSRDTLVEAGASVVRQDHGVAWLTMLVGTPPTKDSVILGIHPRGYAAHMPRSSEVTRFYLQCRPGDDPADWPDDRIWAELHARLTVADGYLSQGPLLEKRVLDLHDYVVSPMSLGRLHLTGDAAHLVAPIGAKGMNLAVFDALQLARAYAAYFHPRGGDSAELDRYSERCLAQAWQYQEFSAWLSEVYHGPAAGGFRAGTAMARLRRLFESEAAARAFSELFIGSRTSV